MFLIDFFKEYKAHKDMQHFRNELAKAKLEAENANLQRDKAVNERDTELEKTRKEQLEIIDSFKERRQSAESLYIKAKIELDNLLNEQKETRDKFNYFVEKLKTSNKIYKKLQNAIDATSTLPMDSASLHILDKREIDTLCATVTIPIHTYDIPDLKALNNNVKSQIKAVYKRYENRYTTKTNKAIYSLMVIALEAELQNILHSLKFSNYDKSIKDLNKITDKYLQIASDGNQSIVPTLTAFIGEMNILYTKRIEIEYNYYIKQEQIRLEQQALREQMKQEAAEQMLLRQQQEKLEIEEQKYTDRIAEIKAQLQSCTDPTKKAELQAAIDELTQKLGTLEQEKEEILKLQNGKAGYVYVISNLGSFGEDVFKIGMTRRLDPTERIRELSSASVPFSFDVHSFIFSDDAVSLENELHKQLDENRVNKINARKEFFKINIDDLEKLVQTIDSSAEFTKTMLALEYRQSQEL